jgi:hypothetical protein
VALWGKVIECEYGFRASHAYPLDLFVIPEYVRSGRLQPEDVTVSLGRYGVSVHHGMIEFGDQAPQIEGSRPP